MPEMFQARHPQRRLHHLPDGGAVTAKSVARAGLMVIGAAVLVAGVASRNEDLGWTGVLVFLVAAWCLDDKAAR